MAKLAIVTDSACSIPHEIQDEYQIAIVPLAFISGETSYLDNGSLSWQQFYALLKSAPRLPTTATAPPGAFLDAFREAHRRGCKDVLCIVTSSRFTGTYNAASDGATLAREQMPDLRVKVIDSRSAAGALGLAVLAAAKSAANGTALEQAASKVEALIPRLYMLGVLDTLEYVAKGGHVPQVAAWLFALLQVKHLFQLHEGEITRLGAVRTKPRALARLDLQRPLHVSVFHTQASEEATDLAREVQEEFRPAELFISELSQVMSIHTGPGLVGLAFYNEP
jgi:DegV family protein with EDD domain